MANAWTAPRWRVVTIGAAIVVGVGLLYLLGRLLFGKHHPGGVGDHLAKIIDKARSDITTANALAAVRLSEAYAKDAATKDELSSIAADDDEMRRLHRLVSLRQRVRQ